jgi:hypothetical protein
MKLHTFSTFRSLPWIACAALTAGTPLHAQLFQNLQALTRTIPVGSGAVDENGKRLDGPRWVCTGKFDADAHWDAAVCHLDGGITVLYGRGDGSFISKPLVSGAGSLRAMVAADLDGDGLDDLAAASPYDAKAALLLSRSGRTWEAPQFLTTFNNARNIAAGDFDGDGTVDLAVAGPDELPMVPEPPPGALSGVMHFRGTGGAHFQNMGKVPEIGTVHDGNGRLSPVYSMQAFRRPGETRDRLGVTHENSNAMWILAANATGSLAVTETLNWWGGGNRSSSPYNVDSLRIGTVFSPASTGNMDLIGVMQGG